MEKISVGVGRGHHKPVQMNQRRRRCPEINIHSGMRKGSRRLKRTDLTHQPIQPSQATGHKIPSLKGQTFIWRGESSTTGTTPLDDTTS